MAGWERLDGALLQGAVDRGREQRRGAARLGRDRASLGPGRGAAAEWEHAPPYSAMAGVGVVPPTPPACQRGKGGCWTI